MVRHRYRTPAVVGPWRSTRGEALRDALKAGQCRRDDDAPEGLAWAVPGEIEADGGGPAHEAGRQLTAA
jgi:hypothetical protein